MAATTASARTLFLHVGPPKTGTSAVQHYLRSHKTPGLLYPEAGRWADGAHHNLVFNYFEDFRRAEVVRESAEQIFRKIETEIHEHDGHVLISSEALVAYDIGRFFDGIRLRIGQHFSNIEILLTYREHFELAASLYNQRVKDPFYMEQRDPNEFLHDQAATICYFPLIRRLVDSGIKMTLVDYHPSATFVPRFLHSAGYRSNETVKDERRNVSLSVRGMIAVLAANRICESQEDRAVLFGALRKMRGFFAPSKFIFDRDTAAAVAPIFDEDRMRLQKMFGLLPTGFYREAAVDCFHLDQQDVAQIKEATVPCGEKGAKLVALAEDLLQNRAKRAVCARF
jgi:hypothetical protein